MLSNDNPMPSDEYENIVPLSEFGFEDEDLIDIHWLDCPEGGAYFYWEMTERGDAILREAAEKAGIDPSEYLQKLMRKQLYEVEPQTWPEIVKQQRQQSERLLAEMDPDNPAWMQEFEDFCTGFAETCEAVCRTLEEMDPEEREAFREGLRADLEQIRDLQTCYAAEDA